MARTVAVRLPPVRNAIADRLAGADLGRGARRRPKSPQIAPETTT